MTKISFGYPYRCVRCGKAWKVNWSSCPECGGSLVEENYAARLLMRIGLVRRRCNGTLRWPLHFAPGWVFRDWRSFRAWVKSHGLFYVFRNRPGVIKWREGRLLPIRWGFGIAGLIEFGDRG